MIFGLDCVWVWIRLNAFSFMNYRSLSNMRECRIIHRVWIIYNSATIKRKIQSIALKVANNWYQLRLKISVWFQRWRKKTTTECTTHDSRYLNGRGSAFSKWLNLLLRSIDSWPIESNSVTRARRSFFSASNDHLHILQQQTTEWNVKDFDACYCETI